MKIDRIKSRVEGKQLSTPNSITCGTGNPGSLKCIFYDLENGEVATVFTPQRIHEGHTGIMHGGLSAAVLDAVSYTHLDVYKRQICGNCAFNRPPNN